MIRTLTPWLLVLGIAGAPGCRQPRPPPVTDARSAALRDSLIALDRTMNQAVDGLDCPKAMGFIADEQPVFISGGRAIRTRAQLASLCDALVAPRTGAVFVPQAVTAHLLSPDAGYVVREGEYTIHYRDGRVRSEHLAMTTIWARRAGRWQMVHLHESMVPAPGGAP
jgi:ketosteroid isomerase-like protein